jgi:hypothetical protein
MLSSAFYYITGLNSTLFTKTKYCYQQLSKHEHTSQATGVPEYCDTMEPTSLSSIRRPSYGLCLLRGKDTSRTSWTKSEGLVGIQLKCYLEDLW